MKDERSLGIDIESVGAGPKADRVARITVVGTHGCTRDGSADTITADCGTLSALEREVGRLRGELDEALASAAVALDGAPAPSPQPRRSENAPRNEGSARPHVNLDVNLSVGDLMTREVSTVRRNDRLSQAKQRMDEGGFRHLVVLDDDDAPAGVLSARDISFNALAWSMGQGAHSYESSLDRALVKDVMHGEIVSTDPAASIRTAAQSMLDCGIGCLPVVDGEALVGIITDADFLKLFPQPD